MPNRNTASEDLHANVRHCLLREWDPIGVQQWPEAHDEYDSYVGGVCRLLLSGADADKIRAHLAHHETVNMGLSQTSENLDAVARKLLSFVER